MKRIGLLLLLSAPLFAQDASARYHQAYVLEVVEGKPADAARRYLALAIDNETPDRIRHQAQFRFAVTCVLLGRADEARARLAELATAEGLPKGLRAQIDEYRKSLQGVERGSALEKKMDELKFAMARGTGNPPPEYREFEVIGDPAIPYLRRLARHRDRALRGHAVRILARMNAPDLVDVWSPSIYAPEVARYFGRHPKQMPAVLARLDGADAQTVHYLAAAPLPLDWIKKQAGRKELHRYMPDLMRPHWGDAAARDLLVEWIRGDDTAFAAAIAHWYVTYIDEQIDTMADPTILRDAARLLRGRQGLQLHLRLLAAKSATNTLVATLDDEVAAGDLVSAEIAGAELLRRKELPRYEASMRAWLFAALAKGPARKSEVDGLRQLAERLPDDKAGALIRKLFEGLDAKAAKRFAPVVGCSRAQDAPLLLAALESSGREEVLLLAADKGTAEFWRALHPSFAALPARYPDLAPVIAVAFKEMAPHLDRPDAVKLGKDLVAAGRRLAIPARLSFFGNLIAMKSSDGVYREHVAPAVLDAVSKGAGSDILRKIVTAALYSLYYGAGTAQDHYLRHVEPNLAYASNAVLKFSYQRVHARVPAEWYIKSVPAFALRTMSTGTKDRAYRYFASHPEEINDNVAQFLAGYRPPDQATLLASLFSTADPQLLRRLMGRDLQRYVPLDTLKPLLANEKLPLDLQARIGRQFVDSRPTRELFPLVRRVLAAKDRSTVVAGVHIARSLGSEELLPDLARLLETLDALVRDRANDAIQSIVLLQKLKAELRDDLR